LRGSPKIVQKRERTSDELFPAKPLSWTGGGGYVGEPELVEGLRKNYERRGAR